MIGLAEAYAENLILKSFMESLNGVSDSECKTLLTKVCNLYALSTIEKNKGWYLETGYLEGNKTKAIRRMINKLCQQLRYEASGLVDAWAIPSSLLGAEIG